MEELYTSLLPGSEEQSTDAFSLLIFHIVLEGLPRIRIGKPGKSKRWERREIKLLLFADYVIVYIENSSDSKQI